MAKSRTAPSTNPASVGSPLVGILMGSASDWEVMQNTTLTLDALGIAYEKRVLSAHRAPRLLFDYVLGAPARGVKILIGGAGGAAHLPGMIAALTQLPVLGVPIDAGSLRGVDSLYSIVQMPGGIPVATFAIGKPGAINAALFSASILALGDPKIAAALAAYRAAQTEKVIAAKLP